MCMIGMTNAPVLPDPVMAMPTTSTPCIMSGMVLRWIGVGSWKPLRLIAFSTGIDRPMFTAGTNLTLRNQGVRARSQLVAQSFRSKATILCLHAKLLQGTVGLLVAAPKLPGFACFALAAFLRLPESLGACCSSSLSEPVPMLMTLSTPWQRFLVTHSSCASQPVVNNQIEIKTRV